jgi:hypothetical protein
LPRQPDHTVLLDGTWIIEIDETRPRAAPTHHTHDTVPRARRPR